MSTTKDIEMPILYSIGLVSFMLCFLKIELSWSYPAIVFKYFSYATLTIHLFTWIQKYAGRQLVFLGLAFFIVIITGYNAQQLSLLYLFHTHLEIPATSSRNHLGSNTSMSLPCESISWRKS